MHYNNCRIKKKNKICILLVLCSLIINITGCSVKKKNSTNEVENNVGDSKYYSKVEVSVPEEWEPQYVCKAEDGGLYVVASQSGGKQELWYMNSDENWENKCDLKDVLSINKDAYCRVFVSPKGDIFAAYNNELNEEDEVNIASSDVKYCWICENGEKTDIDIKLPKLSEARYEELEECYDQKNDYKNAIDYVKFIDDKVYFADINSNIYELNTENSNAKCIFQNNDLEYVYEFSVYENTLIMWDGDVAYFEGLDNHDLEQSMSDRFQPFFSKAKEVGMHIGMDINNNKMYTISGNKISVINLVDDNISVSNCTGCEQTERIHSYVVCDENNYLLVYSNKEKRNILYKYVDLNNDTQVKTYNSDKKLKIWTLQQDQTFSSVVRMYTNKYPDVMVEVEVGIVDADSGITDSDAIKNLNAEIISGEGPDIIYMDGLTLEKYYDDNILYDLTELLEQIKLSGDYFDNVLDSFAKDGKIYVVPSSVQLFGKVGTKESVDVSMQMSEFVEYIKNSESNHSIIPNYDIETYIMGAYYKDIRDNLKGGSISKDELKSFFSSSKELIEHQGGNNMMVDSNVMLRMTNFAGMYDGSFDFVSINCGDLTAYRTSKIDMADKIKGTISIPAEGFEDKYLARECMAISAKSKHVDLAKDYIAVALSEECQSEMGGTMAYQVNKTSLKKYNTFLIDMMSQQEKATNTDAMSKEISEELEIISQSIEKMSSPTYIDRTLDQMVLEEMNSYIAGNKDLESSVDDLVEKVELYLAE